MFRAGGGDGMFLRNARIYRRVHTTPEPRRTSSFFCRSVKRRQSTRLLSSVSSCRKI
jgi:hypothetical protein